MTIENELLPKVGMLYSLTTDINTPDYPLGVDNDPIKTLEILSGFVIPKWHRLQKDDVVLFAKKGKKVINYKNRISIAAVREKRKYPFWVVQKFEYYFIWKDKYIMIVLCEQDWGNVLVPTKI